MGLRKSVLPVLWREGPQWHHGPGVRDSFRALHYAKLTPSRLPDFSRSLGLDVQVPVPARTPDPRRACPLGQWCASGPTGWQRIFQGRPRLRCSRHYIMCEPQTNGPSAGETNYVQWNVSLLNHVTTAIMLPGCPQYRQLEPPAQLTVHSGHQGILRLVEMSGRKANPAAAGPGSNCASLSNLGNSRRFGLIPSRSRERTSWPDTGWAGQKTRP